ncbi:MAG TPA: enoyl-CoA hydratase/isomerase family protein [Aquihabitans sp.]|jgi:enoyl-CoA hydratase/carnithine racemase|nr:enoyl-CoA hydratase/isomerase family protein [Aquihabitans sp.]
MIELERDGDVFVLRMDDGENRFSPELLHAYNDALATVEAAEGSKALVTTGTGKFFSNGLDLDWLAANGSEMLAYLDRVHRLYARLLHLPCVTVAACNGHTFAAGAMLAIAHDHRIMRSDRGYWCLPEVDLGMTFTTGMNALIPAMLPPRTAHEAMITGRRYTAEEAVAAGIVDRAVAEADVLPEAVAFARAMAPKAGPGLGTVRATLHAPVIEALTGSRH